LIYRYSNRIGTIAQEHLIALLVLRLAILSRPKTARAVSNMTRVGSAPTLRAREDMLHPLAVRATHWLTMVAIIVVSVANNYSGGLWEDYGYNWFGGS
jgi:hypothetical protein